MTNLTHNCFILYYVYYSPLNVSSNVELIMRRSNCTNTAFGIVTLKMSEWPKINFRPLTYFQSDYTRCCINKISPPDDEHGIAPDM